MPPNRIHGRIVLAVSLSRSDPLHRLCSSIWKYASVPFLFLFFLKEKLCNRFFQRKTTKDDYREEEKKKIQNFFFFSKIFFFLFCLRCPDIQSRVLFAAGNGSDWAFTAMAVGSAVRRGRRGLLHRDHSACPVLAGQSARVCALHRQSRCDRQRRLLASVVDRRQCGHICRCETHFCHKQFGMSSFSRVFNRTSEKWDKKIKVNKFFKSKIPKTFCTVFAEINAHPNVFSAYQKQWFFQGGSTQNRWLLMSDFSKGGVHKTDMFWWVMFSKGGVHTMAFDEFWNVFLLLLKIKLPGRLFRKIRYFS